MMKTDKELAVEVVSAYISAWFSRSQESIRPLDGDTLETLIKDAYNAIHSLTDGM